MGFLTETPPILLYPLLVPLAGVGLLLSLLVGTILFGITTQVIAALAGTSRYAHLPQPRRPAGLWKYPFLGHIPTIRAKPPAIAHLDWADEVGSRVYVYRQIFFKERLLIADHRALLHMLSQAKCYQYPKAEASRKFLADLLGDGIFSAEGDTHRRQRKVVSPAFTVSSVRAFTPAFFKHAQNLVRVWGEMIDKTEGPADTAFITGQSDYAAKASRKGEPVLDSTWWLSKVTLDIIGETAFGHEFHSLDHTLDGNADQFATDLSALFATLTGLRIPDILRMAIENVRGFGWVRRLPNKREDQRRQLYTAVERQALQLIASKRAEILQEMAAVGLGAGANASEKGAGAAGATISKAAFDEDLGPSNPHGAKDLLHLTMRASMATDLRDNERLSDAELLGQMTSFMLAGHETTSTQTQWALYCLAEQPAVVSRLRQEIEDVLAGREGEDEALDYDELSEMPYLDCVAKEMMRCYAPVPTTMRVASQDDVLPLGSSYRTRDGRSSFNSVPVHRGDEVIVPIQVVNFSAALWGADARQFRPERWLPQHLSAAARDSGMPLHLMTFISGPRGCVGNRFAIAEFKVLLVCILRHFDVARVEGWEVEPKQSVVLRAMVKGQEHLGTQMPLRIRRRDRSAKAAQ